jgi:FtsP/CotA-like multicopper oxidase with cupredoxin domain
LLLEHHTPNRSYTLATFTVAGERATSSPAAHFDVLRRAPELEAERQRLGAWLTAPPDKVLALVAQMDDLVGPEGAGPVTYACPMHPEVTSDEPGRCPTCGMKLLATPAPGAATTGYACPMHPEVTSDEPGHCPKCGMKLLATPAPAAATTGYACPMHPEVTSDEPGHCPKCGMKLLAADLATRPAGHHEGAMHHEAGYGDHDAGHGDHDAGHGAHDAGHDVHDDEEAHDHGHGMSGGIEWEDDMVEVNRLTTSETMHWRFVDRTTGTDNVAIDWRFAVGDRVKIRLVNEMESDHPMHHPFHLHGAGRFLVLARDGVVEENLMWKDTVLVRTGQTVDILFDVSNPGLWMAHCHIAEHMQSGMMFSFTVDR